MADRCNEAARDQCLDLPGLFHSRSDIVQIYGLFETPVVADIDGVVANMPFGAARARSISSYLNELSCGPDKRREI